MRLNRQYLIAEKLDVDKAIVELTHRLESGKTELHEYYAISQYLLLMMNYSDGIGDIIAGWPESDPFKDAVDCPEPEIVEVK